MRANGEGCFSRITKNVSDYWRLRTLKNNKHYEVYGKTQKECKAKMAEKLNDGVKVSNKTLFSEYCYALGILSRVSLSN